MSDRDREGPGRRSERRTASSSHQGNDSEGLAAAAAAAAFAVSSNQVGIPTLTQPPPLHDTLLQNGTNKALTAEAERLLRKLQEQKELNQQFERLDEDKRQEIIELRERLEKQTQQEINELKERLEEKTQQEFREKVKRLEEQTQQEFSDLNERLKQTQEAFKEQEELHAQLKDQIARTIMEKRQSDSLFHENGAQMELERSQHRKYVVDLSAQLQEALTVTKTLKTENEEIQGYNEALRTKLREQKSQRNSNVVGIETNKLENFWLSSVQTLVEDDSSTLKTLFDQYRESFRDPKR